jgi:AMP nucleosidase
MPTRFPEVRAALDELRALYDASVGNLRDALQVYAEQGTPPALEARRQGAFAYPELCVAYEPGGTPPPLSRSYARLNQPGLYSTSITRPDLFADSLTEQLDQLVGDFGATVSVGRSASEIPFPYVLDGSGIELGTISAADLARHFPSTELVHIGDEIADGLYQHQPGKPRPLSLFDGPRTDFSLARLKHYTGTPPEDFQHFVLFTNYARYVDEFIEFATAALREPGSDYSRLAVPGGSYTRDGLVDPQAQVAAGSWRKYQMPAYHLVAEGKRGITLVNIGVGPSNAKTICDHLAVLRPHVWLMIGHCGGLRESQKIGDYVLAHAYLRDDHLLDDLLPPEIPLPAIAEVQQALFQATLAVTGEDEDAVKTRLRTGTVVTTDDRNWELRYTRSALRFNQSRAVAIDMESATVAAQGYRHRVPYGTLLCVSDKPLHGELKLPGQANAFYQFATHQHLRVGIEALGILKQDVEALHSRKLRSFDEPPLR